MNYFIKLLIFIILINFTNILSAADKGYNVVYSKKIGQPMTIREKAAQIYPTMMTISTDGTLFILEEYNDYFKLLKSDLNFEKKNELKISREKMETQKNFEFPDLTLGQNGDIILQSYKRNINYLKLKDNKTEPFFLRKVLHFDRNLKIINDIKVHRIGTILPPFKKQKNFYYMMGNSIHLVDKPSFISNYLTKINNQGAVDQVLYMNDKIIDQLLFNIIDNTIITNYTDQDYITVSNTDMSNENNFKRLSNNPSEKIKNSIYLYVLSPQKKSFRRINDLTDRINQTYEKINSHSLENFIILDAIRYDHKNSNVIFMMWEFDKSTTCSDIVSKHLIKYNLKSHEFKMVKLGSEFFGRSLLAGYVDDICYIFDWNASILYGLKLK